MVFLFFLLRVLVANAIVTRHESNVAMSSSGSKDMGPALAPMPAPKTKEAFAVDFEIHNLNYYDLSKEVCTCKPKMLNGNADTQDETDHAHEREDIMDQIVHNVDGFGDQINNVFKKAASEVTGGASLLQLKAAGKDEKKCTKCTTAMAIMQEAVSHAVVEIIHHTPQPAAISVSAPAPVMVSTNSFQIPGIAPPLAAPSAAFLQNNASQRKTIQPQMTVASPAPGPQMAAITAASPPADPVKDLEIFVTFAPGVSVGPKKSTKVEIAFAEKGHGHHMLDIMPQLMHTAIGTGTFGKGMDSAVSAAIGIHPLLVHIHAGMTKVDLWPVAQCEKHIRELSAQFSVHYTREQVPRALYNECTNFMTKISFSHDYVLDPMDTTRCKKATAKFTKQWEYGKNVDPEDFQSMCVAACKAKFGKHALQCSSQQ